MTHTPYSYKRPHSKRYVFTSIGRRRIEKVVDFVPIGLKNVMNLGFGDLLPDGSVSDTVNSNDGDIVKVLATIIAILKDFTAEYPAIEIFFSGTTPERTKLYTRILRTYYSIFSSEFNISGITGSENKNRRIPFEPKTDIEYLGFLINRIN
jgi:hypothetical protein